MEPNCSSIAKPVSLIGASSMFLKAVPSASARTFSERYCCCLLLPLPPWVDDDDDAAKSSVDIGRLWNERFS